MDNPFLRLSETEAWAVLVTGVRQGAKQSGYRLTRLPGRGRANTWHIERNGQEKRACIRTTRDRRFAFPPLDGGTRWRTLDDADVVFVGAVDDCADPRNVEVYEFQADEVRRRFDAAYEARTRAGQTVRDAFGMWIGLDTDARGIAASVGSGLADRHKPIAVIPIDALLSNAAESEESPSGSSEAARDEPDDLPDPASTISAEVASMRQRIAALTGFPLDAVKIEIRIDP